ncbi:MAG: DUF3592 domain-containing protein [Ruminococcus sp.]|nr:DUF3592 domain-containing protein [Ruminococcus sp.]
MISIKGPGLRIFAAIIAVIALGFGVYSTFFQSSGYETTTATIVSIKEDPDYIPDPDTENDVQYIVTAKYTVDGKEYVEPINSYDPGYKVGGNVEIKYDPSDPSKITSGFGIGIYIMISGGVILLIIIFLTVKQKTSVKKLKGTNGEFTFAPSEKGEERKLYFLTDLGTPKYGHRLEDKNRKVIYEAKNTKFSPLSAFEFDFIDHEHNKTVHHLVGHEEETDWNSLLIDNNYTFTFDGKDIWKQLRSIGVKIDSRFGGGESKGALATYSISRNGDELAFVEMTSQYPHEDDAEKHKVASKVPVQGFYRVRTREKNLDLLFIILVAMARSGASDERGGSRRMLFNTIKGE